MTNTSIRRLQFVTVERPLTWVSEETGIPTSTLSYVNRGLRNLPKQYVDTIRNLYQRESYSRMRNAGASSEQARRYSWYVPTTVGNVMIDYSLKVEELAGGIVAAKLKGLERDATTDEILDLWSDARQSIVEGLQNSRKPLEDILDYGRKNG